MDARNTFDLGGVAMRRIIWGIILLMFLGGSVFSLSCAPGEPDVSDAFPQTEQPTEEGNGGNGGE